MFGPSLPDARRVSLSCIRKMTNSDSPGCTCDLLRQPCDLENIRKQRNPAKHTDSCFGPQACLFTKFVACHHQGTTESEANLEFSRFAGPLTLVDVILSATLLKSAIMRATLCIAVRSPVRDSSTIVDGCNIGFSYHYILITGQSE